MAQNLLTFFPQRTKSRFVVLEKVDEHFGEPSRDEGAHDDAVVELDRNFILSAVIALKHSKHQDGFLARARGVREVGVTAFNRRIVEAQAGTSGRFRTCGLRVGIFSLGFSGFAGFGGHKSIG